MCLVVRESTEKKVNYLIGWETATVKNLSFFFELLLLVFFLHFTETNKEQLS